jgi:hypothetical protein
MSSTKKLLISLIAVAATSAFADSMSTSTSSGESGLEALFKADLEYRSDSQSDAVVTAEEREGVYIGSGDGTVIGDRVRGTVHWSLWSGNCLYPVVRSGQSGPCLPRRVWVSQASLSSRNDCYRSGISTRSAWIAAP